MDQYPGKPPRLDRVFIDRPLFFITFNTHDRQPVLACSAIHDAFVQYCRRGCEMNVVEIGRYVIMPDHIHLFIRGDDNFDPGLWMRGLKRALSKSLPQLREVWQPGFFDHVLRDDESYAEKWEYVRMNPVRKQLVTRPEDWPYAGEIIRIDKA